MDPTNTQDLSVANLPAPKPPNKLLIILAAIVLIGIITATFFGLIKRQPERVTTAQNIASPRPSSSPSPVSSPVSTSIDEIISTSGYTNKSVDYQDNSGSTLDNSNLQIKIPGQSNLFIQPAFAAEMQTLYPIYLQNPEISTLSAMAKVLGIKAEPAYPDSQQKYQVNYSDSDAELRYNSTSAVPLSFESMPGSGDLPSVSEAQTIATTTLLSLGLSLDGLKPSVIKSGISSQYENFVSTHEALAVNYLRERSGNQVVIGDMNFFNNNPYGVSLSPIITVLITGGGKVTRIQIADYGQSLGKAPVTTNSRSLKEAIDELKNYGGHIRNIVEVGGSKIGFACAESKCSVHDAVITKAELSYYWNNSLPSLSYQEINDTNPRAFEYLMPVWVFEGTGGMDKSKTDESGKLVLNPNKSNPQEYYTQNVKFISTIPAITATNDVNILSAKNYTLSKISDTVAQVTFETLYHFPTFNSASFANAEPRSGIKYKLLILFPDKTYTVINSYKQEVYKGEVTFPIGTQKGTITTYLELSDFSNLIEKRTLQID